ncbi:MAG TPA: TIGR03016 family PEP-CTERM system-associated outer membrane protein, partial [Betaproteobacteria bacterium]|nr:TIGR03016 family PEP-CTERM system-associated outer membrane protein [Betaproteobacteria bacterium]
GFNLRRDFQQGGSYDRQTGVFAGWNWRLTPVTSFNLNGNVSRIEVPTSNRVDDFWAVSAGLNRQFQPKLSGSVIARHQARSSNQSGNDYTENSITALVNMSF